MLETKVKLAKVQRVADNLFRGWHWIHNFNTGDHGRIWIAWRPQSYSITMLIHSPQHMHCQVHCQLTSSSFYATFIYGFNHDGPRSQLWKDLRLIADHMDDPWCVLGDFNSVLYASDRKGGTAVLDTEIAAFADTIRECRLHELPSSGPYYSWTNRTVWS